MEKNIIKLKSELLCLGARVEAETAKLLAAEYPRFFDKGFIHAVNLRLAGIDVNICVSVSEEFSAGSPYEIVKIGEDYRLVGNGWDEVISFYPNLPHTGTVVDELARLHSPTCINIWPSTTCCYDTPELKCRFCSLKADADKPIDTDELAEGLKLLLARVPKEYILNFSGGTYHDPDWMVRYWIDLARKIRKFSQVSITVEFAPPSDLGLLMKIHSDIPSGHKVALRDIHVDEDIIKYGESLGEATKEIVAGDYVHVHNLDSKRGRGDWED